MRRKFRVLSLGLFLAGGIYNLWTLRPVNILHVDSDGDGVVVLVVDHMPWTDRDKIDWYLAHREEIRSKYPLFDEIKQSYYILGVGDGFTNYERSPHEDLRCFTVIDSNNYCVIKDYLLIIDEYTNENTRFYVSEGKVEYQLTLKNKIQRVYRPEIFLE